MAPMLTYMADERGMTGEFHLVHYGARALGGTGLLISEMLAVSADGRPTPGCPGLFDDEHVAGWWAINHFVHQHSALTTCAQIRHARARAACRVPHDGCGYDEPLDMPWPISQPWRMRGAHAVLYLKQQLRRT